VTIALALAVVAVLAGCNRKAARNTTPFPASNEVKGWTKTGETRTFDAANLWRYIDGDTEKYLKAGVESTSTSDYKFENNVEAVADVYAMRNQEGARQIFDSQAVGNAKLISMGDAARLYRSSLLFRKGRYLVRIVAYDELPAGSQAIAELGRGIEQRLAD
jgi:hypothetical protein